MHSNSFPLGENVNKVGENEWKCKLIFFFFGFLLFLRAISFIVDDTLQESGQDPSVVSDF